MPFSTNQMRALWAVVGEKLKGICPVCSSVDLRLQDQMVLFPLQSSAVLGAATEGTLPCVIVVCRNCGATYFFNVHALGIAGLVGVPPPGEPIPLLGEGGPSANG
jgi:hypothetical protein